MLTYMKVPPTTYVIHYRAGRVRREGPGLTFWYFRPASTIVAIPLASRDVPFAFSEITADFQAVTLQGQLTYRVTEPRQLAALLDFSVRPTGRYVSEDPDKLPERLVQTAQILARGAVQRRTLRDALVSSEAVVAEVLAALRNAEPVRMLGIEALSLTVLAIRPTPEMARALEAEAREALQRESDEAIYARRMRPSSRSVESRKASCRRKSRFRKSNGKSARHRLRLTSPSRRDVPPSSSGAARTSGAMRMRVPMRWPRRSSRFETWIGARSWR
jgi:regulator of protease activity HflC (stomatin/prohibitin superfamily)